ncbi:hypothetical protein DPMN_024880 [Dreissena polymorpha]|uniref:Uncharacterized protein n=1 Tax=Dreissena polymorpha TaxID=45954 RepID=A0A9D4LS80_DREPO|nr:hypothetical protein DPMN_024880 [Dreissena polymorpha]
MNILTRFHEDRTVNVAPRVLTRFYYCLIRKNDPPPLGSYVFQANISIFEIIQDIIETNLLTKFHKDWTINPYTEKCPAPGGHAFKATKTIFELIQDIIGTNLLTKFHKDWKINMASREFKTRQMLTAHDGRRTTDKRRSQKLTMSTLCSGELKRYTALIVVGVG